MNGWQQISMIGKNQAAAFATAWSSSEDLVFQEATSTFAVESERYDNYKSIFAKAEMFLDANLFLENNMAMSGVMAQSEIVENLDRELLTWKKLEEWNLCYSQVNFESERAEIELEIVKLFSGIEKVKKIYSSQYDKSAFHFQILTNNTRYDRELMMKLLDIEYELGHYYKHLALSFDYIPKIYQSEDEVVVEEAKQIYSCPLSKEKYEFTTNTLTASLPQQAIGEVAFPISSTI